MRVRIRAEAYQHIQIPIWMDGLYKIEVPHHIHFRVCTEGLCRPIATLRPSLETWILHGICLTRVSAEDGFRWTPLHFAAENGHEAVSRLLLDRGADVSAAATGGYGGKTSLHFAAGNGPTSHRAIGLLPLRHAVLRFGGPASSPLARLCPLLLRDLPLEVREGPWERHRPRFRLIQVAQLFHPACVWLLRRNLCPLVSLLVAGDPLVSRAPSDFDDDSRPGPVQRVDVLLRLEGALLPRAGFVRRHPSDGPLRIREDCDSFRSRVSPRCLLQCAGERGEQEKRTVYNIVMIQ